MDDANSTDEDLLADLVEELSAQIRRGEQPDIERLTAAHPRLAGRIRALLPALRAMEQVGAANHAKLVRIPKRLGDYRILHFLGGGSMGMVYEAIRETREHESPATRCAIKILLPGRTRNDLERFQQEAVTADRLRHPNIVPIHGIFHSDGLHYFAMDLIAGEGAHRVLAGLREIRNFVNVSPTPQLSYDSFFGMAESGVSAAERPRIAERLAGMRQTEYYRTVVRMIVQIADSLAHAHRNGVIHRDVKPSNIILEPNDKAWIADFGLAKVDRVDSLTRRGEIVGTLRYIAPERFRGVSQPSCDIYSLGVTLYEMLTLRPAYPQQDAHELQHAVLFQDPPRPRIVDPGIPRDLEAVVLKAIAREPKNRYQTMEALENDLQRILDGQLPLARQSTRKRRIVRWVIENPSQSVTIAALILVTLLVSITVVRLHDQLRMARTEAEEQDRLANDRQLDLLLMQARDRVRGTAPGRRFETLECIDRAESFSRAIGKRHHPKTIAALRETVIAALANPDLHPESTGIALPPGYRAFAWDPDSRTSAVIDRKGTLRIFSAHETSPELTYSESEFIDCRFLTKDAGILARSMHDEWRVIPLPHTNRTTITIRDALACDGREDGKRFAAWHANGSLVSYDADGAILALARTSQSADIGTKNWTLALHPNRPIVALAPEDGPTRVIDTNSGAIIATLPMPIRTSACAWSADGGRLFLAGEGSSPTHPRSCIMKFEVQDAFASPQIWNIEIAPAQLAPDPGGDCLAVADRSGRIVILNIHTGRTLLESNAGAAGLPLRWSQDGSRLAGYSQSGHLLQWIVNRGEEFRMLPSVTGANFGGLAFSRVLDSGRIVSASRADQAVFWELASGRPIGILPTPGAGILPFGQEGELLLQDHGRVFPTERLLVTVDEGSKLVIRYHQTDPADTPVIDQSTDGSVTLASGPSDSSFWLNRESSRKVWSVRPAATAVCLAPDGRWAATSHSNRTVTIWDMRELKSICSIPDTGFNRPRFSPDSRLLWVGNSSGDILQTGSWAIINHLGTVPEAPAFTADGQTVAVSAGDGSIRLMEVASGQLVAMLPHPYRANLTDLQFTPDDRYLVGIANWPEPGLHVWNLAAIRKTLRERDLDWR